LYYSTDASQVRELYPQLDVLDRLGADARFIVSESLRDLPGRRAPADARRVFERHGEITAVHTWRRSGGARNATVVRGRRPDITPSA
jgi:hypothetical protein